MSQTFIPWWCTVLFWFVCSSDTIMLHVAGGSCNFGRELEQQRLCFHV